MATKSSRNALAADIQAVHERVVAQFGVMLQLDVELAASEDLEQMCRALSCVFPPRSLASQGRRDGPSPAAAQRDQPGAMSVEIVPVEWFRRRAGPRRMPEGSSVSPVSRGSIGWRKCACVNSRHKGVARLRLG